MGVLVMKEINLFSKNDALKTPCPKSLTLEGEDAFFL